MKISKIIWNCLLKTSALLLITPPASFSVQKPIWHTQREGEKIYNECWHTSVGSRARDGLRSNGVLISGYIKIKYEGTRAVTSLEILRRGLLRNNVCLCLIQVRGRETKSWKKKHPLLGAREFQQTGSRRSRWQSCRLRQKSRFLTICNFYFSTESSCLL